MPESESLSLSQFGTLYGGLSCRPKGLYINESKGASRPLLQRSWLVSFTSPAQSPLEPLEVVVDPDSKMEQEAGGKWETKHNGLAVFQQGMRNGTTNRKTIQLVVSFIRESNWVHSLPAVITVNHARTVTRHCTDPGVISFYMGTNLS